MVRKGRVSAFGCSLFAMLLAAPAIAQEQEAASPEAELGFDEIILTAQKRDERLLDIPAAISAISGQQLQNLQANSIADMAGFFPGVAATRAAHRAPGRHGDMDGNVHPASTLRHVDALIKADKDFDLIIAPGASHMMNVPGD